MPARHPLLVLAACLLVSAALTAVDHASEAPLPSDSLELATGATMLINSPQNRTLVLGLLERARQNGSELYALGGPPFSLRVSFTAAGQAEYTGSGEMEEIRYSRDLWRWSARLGDYSQVRIFHNRIAYDERTPGPIPLRLQMLRGAVLWSMARVRPGVAMRMASAKWNGMDVMCGLLATEVEPAMTPGRGWGEREYCVDPKAGLLRVYSDAPGIYVTYDYNDALNFHGRILARRITVSEGGDTVLQIHVDSLEDPGPADANAFKPNPQMLANGPGVVLRPPIRLSDVAPSPSGYEGTVQPVIVHVTIDNQGKVKEAEVLQASDPILSNAALAWVQRETYSTMRNGQGIPMQDEAFIQVSFGATH